jgi:hypothetical protein
LTELKVDVDDSRSKIQQCTFPMDDTELRNLVSHVLNAARGCRNALASAMTVDVILERLWMLQDCLGRLVDAASDEPQDAKNLFWSQRANIVAEVLDSLVISRKAQPANVAAATQSRTAIKKLLLELEHMNDGHMLAQSTS